MTIEELILALQGSKGSTPEAYHNAAQHLLRIAGDYHHRIEDALCTASGPERTLTC